MDSDSSYESSKSVTAIKNSTNTIRSSPTNVKAVKHSHDSITVSFDSVAGSSYYTILPFLVANNTSTPLPVCAVEQKHNNSYTWKYLNKGTYSFVVQCRSSTGFSQMNSNQVTLS
jgi:hypothetical protein